MGNISRWMVVSMLVVVGCAGSAGMSVVDDHERGTPAGDARITRDADPSDVPDGSGADVCDSPADAGVDATTEPVDAGVDVYAPPTDSGAPQDASADAKPDTKVDAGPKEPCVSYVSAPASPLWILFVTYTTSATAPFYCPSIVEGNSCQFALRNAGAQQTEYGYRLYPPKGACRVAVPAKCLPCTGGEVEW